MLRAGRLNKIPFEVCPWIHWLCAPVEDGIHALRNPEVEAGRGGFALSIGLDLAAFITQEGITRCGCAVWTCLAHPEWGRLGILGVYGPNSGEGRTALWSLLFHILDSSYRWIMLGDYNLIDNQNSQWGGIWWPCCGTGRQGLDTIHPQIHVD